MAVLILERIFLKELLEWRKVVAILVGFLGVVIAVDPLRSIGKGDWIGYGACLLCVTVFSIAIVWSRLISQTETANSMTFFPGLVTAGVGIIGMLAYAETLNVRLATLLFAMGLSCAIGNICFFIAVKHTTAADRGAIPLHATYLGCSRGLLPISRGAHASHANRSGSDRGIRSIRCGSWR